MNEKYNENYIFHGEFDLAGSSGEPQKFQMSISAPELLDNQVVVYLSFGDKDSKALPLVLRTESLRRLLDEISS